MRTSGCLNHDLFLELRLDVVDVKIVDDVLIPEKSYSTDNFISSFESQYKLGTAAHKPGSFLLNGLYIVQHTNFIANIRGGNKFNSLIFFLIDRYSRKQVTETLNGLECETFRYVNGWIRWQGTNYSLLCSFYFS